MKNSLVNILLLETNKIVDADTISTLVKEKIKSDIDSFKIRYFDDWFHSYKNTIRLDKFNIPQETINKIKEIVLSFPGWFIWRETINKETGGGIVSFEKEYSEEHNVYFKKDNKYLYHVTEKDKVANILTNGLIPSFQKRKFGQFGEEEFYHPKRIYVVSSLQAVNEIIDTFRYAGIYNVSIIQIDKDKLDKGIKFYKDPRMLVPSYYTDSKIPPEVLSTL